MVNGAIPTLMYRSWLVSAASHSVHEHASEIETENDVSYEVKLRWNDLFGLS